MRPANEAARFPVLACSLALELVVNLPRGLREQEEPAAEQDQVAPRELPAEGREQRRRQTGEPRQREQQQDPRDHGAEQPDAPARGCWAFGSFDARIEMKMMLSTPRTISSADRVTSAIQVSGFVSQAIPAVLPFAARRRQPRRVGVCLRSRGSSRRDLLRSAASVPRRVGEDHVEHRRPSHLAALGCQQRGDRPARPCLGDDASRPVSLEVQGEELGRLVPVRGFEPRSRG